MVITQKTIATGKLFTTNMAGLRSLEPVQEGELYLEYNLIRTLVNRSNPDRDASNQSRDR